MLTLSALVWPRWGQHPRCRWLMSTSAALQLALLLTLSVGLLRDHLLTASGLLAAVAVPRPPKPRATGRILDDGTYEVILGDQFAIRHHPVDEFDRRMFLLFLRDIHLVAYPAKRPFLCQTWLADWLGTLVDVYRSSCQNAACPHGRFTNLPPDLLPYSPWRTEVHLQALHAYELGHGSYRRVAAGLGVATATAYRWVRQFGGQVLLVAALFGVVRRSGVVGVDEKWVKVPTNAKSAGKQRQAQTYLAVFAWCYRFTPFTPDAQKRVRGKCPLELAGYDVASLPMAQLCRGQMLHWPPEALGAVVPRL